MSRMASSASLYVTASGKQERGFTLIELLVVVAIIALLLSILLPSLERARAQARGVLCQTSLQSQGRAAYFYSEDNRGFIGRGIMMAGATEYAIYVCTVLKGLGYDGDTLNLFAKQGKLRRALRDFGQQLNCPDYPDEAHVAEGPENETNGKPIEAQLLDYVASAIPIPYPLEQIQYDEPGGGNEGDSYQGEFPPEYVRVSKLDDLPTPAGLIYVTEAHVSLPWNEFRFHHFFLTSQLPFGGRPRIASDQRHPVGLNALFFDMHAATLPMRVMDPGWPNSIGIRLRLFSPLADDAAQYR